MTAVRFVDNVLQITVLPYLDGRSHVLFFTKATHVPIARRIMDFLQKQAIMFCRGHPVYRI